MKEFKISGQSHIIKNVLQHLKNGMLGIGIASKFDYKKKGNTVYFTLKEGETVNLEDIFWFGYLTKD